MPEENHFPTELEDPGEEGGAEGDLGGEEEMGIVDGLCLCLFPEVVDHAVHSVLVAQKLHCRAFTVEELEGLFAEIGDAPALWFPHSGIRQDLRQPADAIYAEGGNLPMLVRPAHHVIAVAVPGQGIGAEDVGLAVVLGAFPFGGCPGEIEELNLLLFVDGLVDDVDEFIDPLVLGLDPFRQRDIPFQASSLVDVGHGCQLVRQGLALGSGNEFGGGHGVDQQFELGLLEGPGAQVVFVLRGVNRLHIVAGHFQGFHIPSDGDAEGVDVPAFLQKPDAIRRGNGMLGVAVALQELQKSQQPDPALILFPGGQFGLFHNNPPQLILILVYYNTFFDGLQAFPPFLLFRIVNMRPLFSKFFLLHIFGLWFTRRR